MIILRIVEFYRLLYYAFARISFLFTTLAGLGRIII